MKPIYELSKKGLNAAIGNYIKDKWKELTLNGIDNSLVLDWENVSVFIQSAFKGESGYTFQGEARPRLSDNMGGYTVDTYIINGAASIQIKDNEPCVLALDNISMKKK